MYHSQTSHSGEQVKDQTSFILPPFILASELQHEQFSSITSLVYPRQVMRWRETTRLSNFLSNPSSFYSISDRDRGFPTSHQLSVALWTERQTLVVHQLFDHKNELPILLGGPWLLGVAAGTEDSFRRWSCLMSPMHRFYSGATYLSSLHWCLTPFHRLGVRHVPLSFHSR